MNNIYGDMTLSLLYPEKNYCVLYQTGTYGARDKAQENR